MSYSFDDLAARERRRWMQPWAINMMSPAERQADLERWRDRLRHPDHRLWNYDAVQAQRSHLNPSPHLTARRQIGPSTPRGAGPSLGELLKLKSDAAALRVQLAVIRHEIAVRKAHGRPPLTEADEGWQIILRGLSRYQDACRKAGFNPDQPRVPAGGPGGGQWTSGGGGGAGGNATGGINDLPILSDATPDNSWSPGAQYAQAKPGSGPRSSANPVDVVLPDGSKIPDEKSPTGYMQSPAADLSDVAAAGRKTGETYQLLLDNPETAPGALGFLGVSMYRDISQGGTYDYQREANSEGGYTQLRQYRNVSNFNVGLYCQQAGLSLDETLRLSGAYAMFRSSNAESSQPYGLDPKTRHYTEIGFEAGRRGFFRSPR